MHPVLLHLGYIVLPTFGVLAAIGLMAGLLFSEKTAKLAGVDPAKLWNAGLFAVIAAFVFSRLLLVLTHLQSFLRFPILLLAVPSLTASGLLLTVIATGIWLWTKQIPILRALDAWAPCAALVWGFLALGHWAEGSDPGMTSRWGWQHPIGLYVAALAWIITAAGIRSLQRTRHSAALVLIAAGTAQFLLSFLRVPGEFLHGLDLVQWAALGMIAAGAVLSTRLVRQGQRPDSHQPGAQPRSDPPASQGAESPTQ